MIVQRGLLHSRIPVLTRTTQIRCQNERTDFSGPFVLVDVPPGRKSTLEPQRVPIVHSPAYFLQAEKEADLLPEVIQQESSAAPSSPSAETNNFEENPVDWMLSNADEMLNEMERNPTEATKAIWQMSNSPIGKGTAAGVRTAAKVTLKAGAEAVKIAVPVGTWALKEGLKTMTKIMTNTKDKE